MFWVPAVGIAIALLVLRVQHLRIRDRQRRADQIRAAKRAALRDALLNDRSIWWTGKYWNHD